MLYRVMSEFPERTLSDAVISAVAEREGVEKIALNQSLYDTVDPDALDMLFRNNYGQVTFEYCGYHVTVDAERNVTLRNPTRIK